MRVSSLKTKQALLVVATESVDPDLMPESLELFDEEGTPVILGGLPDPFMLPGLPTTDPGVTDAVWNDAGILKISGYS